MFTEQEWVWGTVINFKSLEYNSQQSFMAFTLLVFPFINGTFSHYLYSSVTQVTAVRQIQIVKPLNLFVNVFSCYSTSVLPHSK